MKKKAKNDIFKFELNYIDSRHLPLTAGDLIVGKGYYKDKVAIVYGSCYYDYSIIYLNNKKPKTIKFTWNNWDHIWTKIGQVHNIDLIVNKLGKGYNWGDLIIYNTLECLTRSSVMSS